MAGKLFLEVYLCKLIAENLLPHIYYWKLIGGDWLLEIDCLLYIAGKLIAGI